MEKPFCYKCGKQNKLYSAGFYSNTGELQTKFECGNSSCSEGPVTNIFKAWYIFIIFTSLLAGYFPFVMWIIRLSGGDAALFFGLFSFAPLILLLVGIMYGFQKLERYYFPDKEIKE
jgi:hypothetical protein